MDQHAAAYEVYVLSKDGWALLARFGAQGQKAALIEAKAAEARLAAATKVVRSEFLPRSKSLSRQEIYSSRLTPAEVGHRLELSSHVAAGAQGRAGARPLSLVVLHLLGIVGVAALLSGLITVAAKVMFAGSLPVLGSIAPAHWRMLLTGVFLVGLLLTAVPWVVSYSRRVGEIDFGSKPRPQPQPHSSPRRHLNPDAAAAADAVPAGPAPGVAVPPQQTFPAAPWAAGASQDPAEAPVAEAETGPNAEPDEQAEAGDGTADEGARAEVMRRTLMRFLDGLVTQLQATRRHLDAYERLGLALLIAGATQSLRQGAGIGDRTHRRLLGEALGILRMQTPTDLLIEEVEGEAEDMRGRRMIQAGRTAMLQFLRGGSDYMVAVLAALEQWTRPSGAIGSGVVAALVAEAWPLSDDVEAAAREVAQAAGGAVLGLADGIVLLIPGAGRAVDAACDLQWRLPAAARIGIDAAEVASEEDAVACVGVARGVCQAGQPGDILVSAAVYGLYAAGAPAAFEALPQGEQRPPLFRLVVTPGPEAAEDAATAAAIEPTA